MHFPLIDCGGASEPIESLLAKFHSAGVHPVIRDITSELGICSVIASAATDDMPGFPQVHSGMGAHPNARVAVVRALTELAQSRAADIQAAREDITPAGVEPQSPCNHLRRAQLIDRRRWHLNPTGPVRRFGEMANLEHEDIADDIRYILSRLAAHGMDRVIFVDFTEPKGFSVGRVLVPGLEFWAMEKGPIGPRALAYWRRNVQ
jgi:YcaO-like protein with predicted kinase domain